MSLARIVDADYVDVPVEDGTAELPASPEEMARLIEQLETQMREAAKIFEFEKAAKLRDRIKALKTQDLTGAVKADA